MAVSLLKVVLACVPLMAVCAAANAWLLAGWATQSFWIKAGAVGLTVAVGSAAFAASCLALRIDEVDPLAAALRRRISR
jgi:hypothetical protein